jgi:uncharacterized membrane protein YraQ (UPF0718 family)
MYVLLGISALALIASFIADTRKTIQALKIAAKKFIDVASDLSVMIVLVSISLYFLPEQTVAAYLGENNLLVSVLIAILIGSITMMPGFIAFPLCGLLLQQGVPYTVLGAFTTSLMMIGVVTYPLERSYFGSTVTLLRNGISLLIALLVALFIGLLYRELL